ncbi:PTS sugar transporter [Nostocoides sp. F2B08]|uniref:PTS sugar transporter subunit IIA n=1 Tax=Nostocoides sp. F2B08 TaxID=2653936 RepID=UPI001263A243|nr:PTS sugar transporter subunit IIA [Tetrasphaera sp. F2B08]KAB7746238.1 PTS sugar transporter [Tetrasphaera sp. F2B08]
MPALHELLAQDAVELDVEVDGWEGAVRHAGGLLERSGVADERYTQAMVDSVVDKGPYIVVAPGFAFAHARPSDAVHRTGMSWVRLARPVEFGHTKNDPVSLVVALAAKDSSAHLDAMAQLAKVLGDTERTAALDAATSTEGIRAVLSEGTSVETDATPVGTTASESASASGDQATGTTTDKILTVCGNGLGTSLFLKNTLEQVLSTWGWAPYITVEATDTISARGKAKEADLIFTSGEIARALGEVGVPVEVIENFTSTTEIDSALRRLYDV